MIQSVVEQTHLTNETLGAVQYMLIVDARILMTKLPSLISLLKRSKLELSD